MGCYQNKISICGNPKKIGMTDDDLDHIYLDTAASTPLADEVIAEVVGSNPTRSTFINLVNYGIELSSFLVVVGQNPHEPSYYIRPDVNASTTDR
jgi:hypothetical protein